MRHDRISMPRAIAGGVYASLPPGRIPRAIQRGGQIQAQDDAVEILHQIRSAVDAMRSDSDARFAAIEAEMGQNAVIAAAHRLNGPSGGTEAPDPEYTKTFASVIRHNRTADVQRLEEANASGIRKDIKAAMSVGTDSAGGYVAPVEWDRQIRQKLVAFSPFRQLADVQFTSVRGYSTVWSDNAWGSGWVGETAARPQTTNPTLSSIAFTHGEIYANAAITQQLLDDADFDLENWIGTSLGTEFARQEGIAFVSGSGVNQPTGWMQYLTGGAATHPGGSITTTPSGAAAAILSDSLVDLLYSLTSPYRANATWVMNSLTAAIIAKLKDGQGLYLWRESFLANQPPTLLGRPVAIDENMPGVAAGNVPVAIGDWKSGYVINDRKGTSILRDPFTQKPYVNLYATRRVGGGLKDPNAIKALKIAAS